MTDHHGIVFGALTWNLFHGRDFPPDPALLTWRSRLLRITERGTTHAQVNRPLLREFAQALDGLPWELALLQEAPPRWLGRLAESCGASGALGLTARNQLAWARAAAARLNPDLIASNEGGSNMVLVRGPGRVEETEQLELHPPRERRALLLARVTLPGGQRLAVGATHLSVPSKGRGREELLRAAERAVAYAGSEPLLLGGDLNLRPAQHAGAFTEVERRFGLAPPTPGRAIDHLLVRGLDVVEPPRALADEAREVPGPDGLRLRLSDHAPVAARFRLR